MLKTFLPEIRFDLFDGEGAAAPSGEMGDSQASPVDTQRGNSGEQKIVYGKQATDQMPETKKIPDAEETKPKSLEERRKVFQAMVNGEFKDIYTEETQRIINRRFRETQNLEKQIGQYQPLITMLMQRYDIQDGNIEKLTQAIDNDQNYWADAAKEAGMSIAQYKTFLQLKRENHAWKQEEMRRKTSQKAEQQLQKWHLEAENLKIIYPGFDFAAEAENPNFLSLLRSGVPLKQAFEVIHMDDIVAGAEAAQAAATEKQIVDGIRAKGARPKENGSSSQSAFLVKDDVSKLTKKDRAEIARRAALGEQISF